MLKLARPRIQEDAITKVVEILRSGNFVQGHHVRAFEETLEEYLSVRHAVACASGTAALHLALLAADIHEGEEVICPAFTFPATANAVERAGAKTVLVDITLDDFCIDASKIEKSVTEKTGAVIVVHEFGQSAEIDKILALADSLELKVIEDAACALGTEYNGLKAGTFGLMGCFSFHPRKAITTGEGGLIVTDDDDLACKLRALRNHGISLENGHQDFIYAGLNYRMTEFQAALGLSQLAMIEDSIVARIRQAERYDKALMTTDMIRTPPLFNNRRATYQTYHILADDIIDRNKLIASFKAAGIETNLGAQAINCLTYYRHNYGYAPDDFPNATKAYQQGLALPIGNHLKDEDIDFIAETLIKILKNT